MNHNNVVLEEIARSGFARLDCPTLTPSTCGQIYAAFDEVLRDIDELDTQIASYDSYLGEFLAARDGHSAVDTMGFKRTQKNKLSHINSFTYVSGFYPFLENHKALSNPSIERLLRLMEQSCDDVFPVMQKLLPEEIQEKGFSCLLKVNRYVADTDTDYILAPHYDRSYLTLVGHPQNSDSERLVIYPESKGIQIQDRNWKQKPMRLEANHFPLLFTGLEGMRALGVPATAHAVFNHPDKAPSLSRHALIFFLFPKF